MTHAPNDYALVIGVDQYPDWAGGAKSLHGPKEDASDVRDWLIDPRGGGLLPDHAELVVSDSGPPRPLKDSVEEALDRIVALSEGQPRRRFYLYFSGHGYMPPGDGREHALCLANWSRTRQGAALNLESYVKAAVGCLAFEEGIYLIDCCRTREVAPTGQITEHECGQPRYSRRHRAVLYATEDWEPGFEGPDDGDNVRGYFTAALLNVLREGRIELKDLFRRLQTDVPERAQADGKNQDPRMADNTARAIFFGPPADASDVPDTGPPVPPPAEPGPMAELKVVLHTNLRTKSLSPGDSEPPPQPGAIEVWRGGELVGESVGTYSSPPLPLDTYKVVVRHAGARTALDVDLNEDVIAPIALPRRRSVAPFSSTLDKHEWVTDPAVSASRWRKGDPEPGDAGARSLDADQAVFVARRQVSGGELGGWQTDNSWGLMLTSPDGHIVDVEEGLELRPANQTGSWLLSDLRGQGGLTMSLPVARGWDTQIFLAQSDDRVQFDRASIFMRTAGTGFDPGDALLDAYEQALVNLANGGPGLDPTARNNLLWGKWKNPLFGLVGAHFLLRELREREEISESDADNTDTIIGNLGELLGHRSADVVALRVAQSLLLRRALPSPPRAVPLFRLGMKALVEATSLRPAWLGNLEAVALTIVPGTPWSCWRKAPFHHGSASLVGDTVRHRVGADEWALNALEVALKKDGFDPRRETVGEEGVIVFERPAHRQDSLDLPEPYRRLRRIPDWLVGLVAEQLQGHIRNERQSHFFANMTRRSGIPRRLLEDAARIARLAPGFESVGEATA